MNSKMDNDFQNKNLMTLDSLDDNIKNLNEKKLQKEKDEYAVIKQYTDKLALKQNELEKLLTDQLNMQEEE